MRLLEQLDTVNHLGELNRLLSRFKELEEERIDRAGLIHLTEQTAGAGYRYPNPEAAIRLGLSIGLIKEKMNNVHITSLGKLFSDQPLQNVIDLNPRQGKMLFGLLLDDSEFISLITSLMRFFRYNDSGKLFMHPSGVLLDNDEKVIIRTLQQLGVLRYEENRLLLITTFELLMPPTIVAAARITEEELWKRLEERRLRARNVEKMVVNEEKRRLSELGQIDLADMVYRISATDASAGYDIHSFNEDGSARFIEVKSSIGIHIKFFWSLHERQIAVEKNDAFWIYFVPFAHTLPRLAYPIILIKNPIREIRAGTLVETPSGYAVSARSELMPGLKRDDSTSNAMVEWPA